MESDFTIRNEVDSVRPPYADAPYAGPDNAAGYSEVSFLPPPPSQQANPFLSPIDVSGQTRLLDHYYFLVREYQANNFKLAMAAISTVKWIAIAAIFISCVWFFKKKAKT